MTSGRLQSLVQKIRPWQIVGIFCCLYLILVLGANRWDPMSLVIVGSRFDPGLSEGTMGYDGQFAWQIARAPLEGWQYLDKPAYRYQRILYPALAGALSFGQSWLLPWILPLINLIAITTGTWITERILAHFKVNGWYALVFGLNIGMLMALRLDLTEPLAFLFFQLGAWLFFREKWASSAAAFALAALGKEVTLVLIAGFGLALLLRGLHKMTLWWSGIVLGPFLVWQLVLFNWFGTPGIDSGGAMAGSFSFVPLGGWWALLRHDLGAFLFVSALIFPLAILPSLLGLGASLRAILLRDFHPSVWALALQGAVFLFLPSSNMLDPLGVSRFVIGLITALLTFGAYRRSKRVLLYTQVWMLFLVFLISDSILPHG